MITRIETIHANHKEDFGNIDMGKTTSSLYEMIDILWNKLEPTTRLLAKLAEIRVDTSLSPEHIKEVAEAKEISQDIKIEINKTTEAWTGDSSIYDNVIGQLYNIVDNNQKTLLAEYLFLYGFLL